MALEVRRDEYLTDEEIRSWRRLQIGEGTHLIDPRALEWLKEKGFDLNQPIVTRRIDREERTLYSQIRVVEKKVMIPGITIPS